MIRKMALAAAFCLGLMPLHAQNKKGYSAPDYKAIERVTKDKTSTSYYPKLMGRYKAHDASLSADDYKLLYYGYFFQDGYKSYGSASRYNDSLKAIFRKEEITDDDRRNAVKYTLDDLNTSPLSLKDIYRLYNLYDILKDKKNMAIYLGKLEMLAKVISSTGDAMTDSTGLHVLSVEDEYTIISLLGYEYGGSQHLTPHPCDYLTLKKNDDGIAGLYFDVRQVLVKNAKVK